MTPKNTYKLAVPSRLRGHNAVNCVPLPGSVRDPVLVWTDHEYGIDWAGESAEFGGICFGNLTKADLVHRAETR